MRESMGQKKCKLNNKGMSLIEVMVAVIIMALVTAPLLHAFVTAAKFNVRSKERQRATSAVQSIMEGLKAYDLEEICYYFNGLSAYNVYPGVGSVWELPTEDRDFNGSLDTSARYEGSKRIFTPTLTNSYTFCMKNIPFESTFYDAQVKVSPNAATGSTIVAVPPDMNAYLDAVYKQSSYDDENAYSQIKGKVLAEVNSKPTNLEYTLDDLQTGKITIDKTTNIIISKDPTNGNVDIVKIESVYDYGVTDYPYKDYSGVIQIFTKSFTPPITMPINEVYNNTATIGDGAKLENIYIFYYPAYENGGVRIDSEKIDIINDSGSEKNVYLIKQINEGLGPIGLDYCENSYTPEISGSGDSIQLYHNLSTNLSNPSGTTPGPNITGNITPHTDILPTDSKILVYDVQVSIYEQGAADALFTDPPILTLTGSINDH